MHNILAYSAAFISSLCFGLASVLEQIGTKRVASLGTLSAGNTVALLRQIPYLVGLVLDGVAFVAFLVAAHWLPLFFVQAVGTSSIVVTAVASRYFLGSRLKPRDKWLIAAVLAGLLLLSYAAAPETARLISADLRDALLIGAAVIVVVIFAFSRVISKRPMAAALLSGLSFSGVAIASRVIPATLHLPTLLASLVLYALIVYGFLGMWLFSIALQKGLVTQVNATNFATETILPTVFGLWFLGDKPHNGAWPIMVIGLGVIIVSTTVLALSNDTATKR